MKCLLCLEEKPLQKKSHIISNFLFKDVFDNKHRMALFRTENESIISKPVQTGLYESNILCAECDNEKIGNLERYASKKLFSPVKEYSKILPPPKENSSKVFIVDYQRIKLFFLSLLWRMSITKNKHYKTIDLGKYEDIIRKMIFENNPMEIDDYAFILFSLINNNNYANSKSYIRIFHSPKKSKIDKGYEYIMQLPGFIVVIRISKIKKVNYTEFSYLDKDKIRVFFPPEKDAKYFVNRICGKNVS